MIPPLEGEFVATSESVTPGHPDKVADRIADAILDAHLERDRGTRMACEVLVTGRTVVLAGERCTAAQVDVEDVVRRTVRDLGYDRAVLGFWDSGVEILNRMTEQSEEIASAVDRDGGTLGAGDQGFVVGYACDETEALMPLPIVLAHRLAGRLDSVRRSGELPWLRPDGKTQVSVRYRDGRPVSITALVVSCQHEKGVDKGVLREAVLETVVRPALEGTVPLAAEPLVNPSGSFVLGGPAADTGLTGRKLAVDTYGGAVPHGGGAFSGKDATKVDRSGAYAARQAAKAIVAAGLARRALVQVAWAIGRPDPVAFAVTTEGTGLIHDGEIARRLREAVAMSPGAIIGRLGLDRPVFGPTAALGHFGREEAEFAWERVEAIVPRITDGKEHA